MQAIFTELGYELVVEWDPVSKSGKLFSPDKERLEEEVELEAALDGIESLVLAHAVAGVDVNSLAYREGLHTAFEAVCNQLT